jgi:hypothetical protein
MTANANPIFTATPNVGPVKITAANTKSSGDGTVGTDIFKAFTAGANGSWVSKVRSVAAATVASTTMQATVLRVYYSTVGSGTTTGGTDTFLIAEAAIPAQVADTTANPVNIIEIPINIAIPANSFIHVSTHAAPAASTVVEALVLGGDY